MANATFDYSTGYRNPARNAVARISTHHKLLLAQAHQLAAMENSRRLNRPSQFNVVVLPPVHLHELDKFNHPCLVIARGLAFLLPDNGVFVLSPVRMVMALGIARPTRTGEVVLLITAEHPLLGVLDISETISQLPQHPSRPLQLFRSL